MAELLSKYSQILSRQFHPTLNGKDTPDTVSSGCGKKFYWIYPYDDPRTGRHFEFVWDSKISNRNKTGNDCPYIANKKVWEGYNDLETLYPEIAKQWHPWKNGNLMPKDIVYSTQKKYWWFLPYDDPITGKHFDFEWDARVDHRTKDGAGCPFFEGEVWKGFNDLATLYPEIAREWDYENNTKRPDEVHAKSGETVAWKLEYFDDRTGKHFTFRWPARICNRTILGNGCPVFSGKMVWKGFNDLETLCPELAAEWHPTANGNLKPDMVTSHYSKKVIWLKKHYDPETKKTFDFEWDEYVYNRSNGAGCPFLSGHRLYSGFNDLQTRFPEVAMLWHPTKNGQLKPSEVMPFSRDKVWWFYPYDDSVTGKHFDFEWEAVISNVSNGNRCPFLSGQRVWKGYNDLASRCPELLTEWDYEENKGLNPDEVLWTSTLYAAWKIIQKDENGIEHELKWKSRISHRTLDGIGCPQLSNRKIKADFNSLSAKYPEIADEWFYEKNDKTPDEVAPSSAYYAWWKKKVVDPVSREEKVLVWGSAVYDRTSHGSDCPYLSGNSVLKGFNDLAYCRPDLASQWHPTKNGELTPEMVTCNSAKKVWWLLKHIDQKTGKEWEMEWDDYIFARTTGENGCPYLSGKRVLKGFNDLATGYPEIAAQWHPTLNTPLTPECVTSGSGVHAFWLMPYDDPITGKHFDFIWDTTVANRTVGNTGCPYLENVKVWPGYNDLATRYPEVAKEWHPTKNGGLKPEDVCYASTMYVTWLMPYDDPITGKHFDFEWNTNVANRTIAGTGCPYIVNMKVWPGYNDLATRYPEVAKEWHPTKNGGLKPEDVCYASRMYVTWLMPYDDPLTGKHFDFEWNSDVVSRTIEGTGCPYLSNKKVWPGYNDLQTRFPQIAEEFDVCKNHSKTPRTIYCYSAKKVAWKCKCGHHWRMRVVDRTKKGYGCKKCTKLNRYSF